MILRVGVVPIEEVLPYVPVQGSPPHGHPREHPGRPFKVYHGYKIFLDSLRYQTFVKSGIQCVVCGLTASYFAVERHHTTKEDVYHLNLYGVKRRKEILFTKDHIIPRSRGGKDHLQNFQTMCAPCNDLKGNYQGEDGIQTTCTADPKKVQQKRANRLANLLVRVEKKLAQLRQDGKKLFVEGSLDGGPEFLAYHVKNDLKKKILRQRHKNLVARFLQQKTERAEARERKKATRIGPDFVITSLGGPGESGDAETEDDQSIGGDPVSDDKSSNNEQH